MRLFRYDPLERKLDRAAKSYWQTLDNTTSMEQYFKQF
jgi:hypothetical protein